MRILIVKTSSMGDVIHTLPALTDLHDSYPHVIIDWVVEEDFFEIPKAHKAVNKIIVVAIRRWRKNLFNKKTMIEIKQFLKNLREYQYDYIIDAQGLLKSVLVAKLAKLSSKGHCYGLDSQSTRGKYISWLYQYSYHVDKNLHAIYRLKLLFSKIFKFNYNKDILNYGLDYNEINSTAKKPYLVFLHCTTWQSKKWPELYWRQLIKLALDNGYNIRLNSGNFQEVADAESLAKDFDSNRVSVMPPQSIEKLMIIIANSQGVVCVDTGLGHLAAALNKPGVGIFGATTPKLTSILSNKFVNIAANYHCSPCFLRKCDKIIDNKAKYSPCYQDVTPEQIWHALQINILKTI